MSDESELPGPLFAFLLPVLFIFALIVLAIPIGAVWIVRGVGRALRAI